MYAQLSQFGASPVNALPVYNNDPLTYCIGSNASQRFNHGSHAVTYGQNSRPCQVYMANRCAQNWDGVCEYAASKTANEEYSQVADSMFAGNQQTIGLSSGDVLLKNTAQDRFRIGMMNCELRTEPFDPVNPSSPYISYYVGQNCVPQYAVDPTTIDQDIVMNKILDRPHIAKQLLINIKNTMVRQGTFHRLKGTRLGNFYRL
ncbi:hypothetical protein [carnivorous sponge associated iridovirus]|nr:hypothetical protein [carnivorous sponge associated iridovirus]